MWVPLQRYKGLSNSPRLVRRDAVEVMIVGAVCTVLDVVRAELCRGWLVGY